MLTFFIFGLNTEVHSTLIQVTKDTKLGDDMNTQRTQTDDKKRSRMK